MKSVKNLLHVLLIFIGLLSLNAQAGVEITYIHNDALGSPVAGTDEQGNVKWRSHYQPYGEERLGERQLFGVRSGYTGHREDPETGLTYMGARYYSPTIGRFMGVDPAGVNESNIHSFNRYAYANNNPYKYVDPDGEIPLLFLIPLVLKAVDAGFTAYDTYTAYQEGGASGAAQELGTSAALSVVPGAKILGKVGKQVAKRGDDWAKLSGQLRDAAKGKGNFGIGSGTREQADAMGKAWVGNGYKTASDGKTLVSKDGMRQFRPPSYKPRLDKAQANFEQRLPGQKSNRWQSNGHLDITD